MTYDDWKADISNEHGSAPDGPEEDDSPSEPRMLIGASHWWQDCGEIARLLRWLHIDSEEHSPIEVEEAIDVVEKPWHWDAEYSVMCREQEGSGVARENERLARSEEP